MAMLCFMQMAISLRGYSRLATDENNTHFCLITNVLCDYLILFTDFVNSRFVNAENNTHFFMIFFIGYAIADLCVDQKKEFAHCFYLPFSESAKYT